MIPKVIHYCWFGHSPKPDLLQRCIKSWEKYCPDYEIVEWNEANFDVTICPYVKEAYDAKKWAFVTDFVRLWIIYHYGGIYLDTDVELVKPLDDLLHAAAFFASEDGKRINTGLGFGAEKQNVVVGRMLSDYEGVHFLKSDGSFNMTTCPVRNTASISQWLSVEIKIDKIVKIENALIYPPEYFCPLSADGTEMKKTKNTHGIHWFSATWLSHDEMIVHEYRIFRNKCEKHFGKYLGGYLARGIYLFFPKKRAVLKRM